MLVAERGRNRAFVDLLLERQGLEMKTKTKTSRMEDLGLNTLDHLKEIVNRQRASVIYYSIAAGYLFAWLIVPTKGMISSSLLIYNNNNTGHSKTIRRF